MKTKKFLMGILAVALIFGMMVVGCEEEITPTPPPPPPAQPGDSASNPIDRVENNTNLGTMTSSASGWRQLLNSINGTGKYVNLDLSACTMTGTSFNPDPSVETGKEYIVSIILPTAATSIEAGTYSVTTFKNFTNLKSVAGANIITIGDYSFHDGDYRYDYLKSVDFPKATTIGERAFSDTDLETVNFPLVTTIGEDAFYSCESLENINFPVVQTIGVNAFRFCSGLESISFPASAQLGFFSSDSSYSNPFTYCEKITFTLSGTGSLSVIENGKALVRNSTILLAYPSASGNITMNNITALDGKVFQSCYDLTGINFPNVTSIGSETFASCYNIQDANFPKATNIGSSAFSSCSRLQSASFPEATVISYMAFSGCPLSTLSIPKVTTIERYAFETGGDTTLTITMGTTAPTNLASSIFGSGTTAKTVKIKIPSGATGYTPAASPFAGTSVTVSGTNTTANWANGLRGGSWNGYSFLTSDGGTYYINQNISLTIEQQ
jgi:hypothetical protein